MLILLAISRVLQWKKMRGVRIFSSSYETARNIVCINDRGGRGRSNKENSQILGLAGLSWSDSWPEKSNHGKLGRLVYKRMGDRAPSVWEDSLGRRNCARGPVVIYLFFSHSFFFLPMMNRSYTQEVKFKEVQTFNFSKKDCQ